MEGKGKRNRSNSLSLPPRNFISIYCTYESKIALTVLDIKAKAIEAKSDACRGENEMALRKNPKRPTRYMISEDVAGTRRLPPLVPGVKEQRLSGQRKNKTAPSSLVSLSSSMEGLLSSEDNCYYYKVVLLVDLRNEL